jgi:D-amino peptidase
MKIYIMTDMECLSGNTRPFKGLPPYMVNRLTGDTNAAIKGAFDGGADEVILRDGHFRGKNMKRSRIDKRAVFDDDRSRWCGCMDSGFDATIMIGQHAMAGTYRAFLDHTQNSKAWFVHSLNGRPVGEIGEWAAMAGYFGVPLIFVAGDRAGCAEAGKLIPGIFTCATLRGIERSRAVALPLSEAHNKIRRGVARAVRGYRRVKPFRVKCPVKSRLTLYRTDMADKIAKLNPGCKRVDGRTLLKIAKTPLDMFMVED